MFEDRTEAGKQLAKALKGYQGRKDVLVVALPRVVVVVGYEVAKLLSLPLEIVVPRKIGHPDNPEYAVGAIDEEGQGFFNPREIAEVSKTWLKEEVKKEIEEAKRRLSTYRAGLPERNFQRKTVILVDDGVATGYTMAAAINQAKKLGAKKIVIAVPHGAPDSLRQLQTLVDDLVALRRPTFYMAVGAFYQNFPQTSDEEVIKLIQSLAKNLKQTRVRAAGIVIRGKEVLVMFRRKTGKEYYCFPGGAVNKSEKIEDAVVREIKEETTLKVKTEKLLYHLIHDESSEQLFYLCRYLSGEPQLGQGEEVKAISEENYYQPLWIKLEKLPQLLLYPLEVRDWLIKDLKNNFTETPRQLRIKFSELRQS